MKRPKWNSSAQARRAGGESDDEFKPQAFVWRLAAQTVERRAAEVAVSRQRQSVTGILPFGHYSRSSEPLCARTKDNAGRLRQAVVAREGAQRGQTPWQKTLIVLEKVGRLGRHSADGTAWNFAGRWRPRRWLGRRNVSHGRKSTHRKCEKRKKEK